MKDKIPTGNDVSKTLHNSTVSGASKNVSDLVVYGNGDTFKLICKASSKSEGWMKSTKAMQIDGVGCLVQVTTQQGNNVAEALTFVTGVKIELIDGDKDNGRRLVSIYETSGKTKKGINMNGQLNINDEDESNESYNGGNGPKKGGG